jgi:hypothetical protein
VQRSPGGDAKSPGEPLRGTSGYARHHGGSCPVCSFGPKQVARTDDQRSLVGWHLGEQRRRPQHSLAVSVANPNDGIPGNNDVGMRCAYPNLCGLGATGMAIV